MNETWNRAEIQENTPKEECKEALFCFNDV
jgi:hypothetical protein